MSQKDQPICKICGKEAPHYFSVGKANGAQLFKEFYCDEHLRDIYDPIKAKE